MKENVGGMDRAARIVLGPALILSGILSRGRRPWGLIATIAGAALTQTSITKVCPMNRALGVNTAD